MLKDDKRDVWLAFLEKILALKTIVDNVKKYARVFTRTRPVILQEPEDIHGSLNEQKYFEVIADNVSGYQWQYKRKTSTTWTNSTLSGNKTNKLPITITNDRTLYNYRCKITGIDNSVIYTIIVNVFIEE